MKAHNCSEPLTKFQVFLNLDNDAFQPDPTEEIVRILRDIADRMEIEGETPEFFKTILDYNGNDVGRYSAKPASHR